MKRRLEIEVIKDERFSNTPQKDVINMVCKIKADLINMADVLVYDIRRLDFGDCLSFRQKMLIDKKDGIKWNEIYAVVNNTYAPYYKKV